MQNFSSPKLVLEETFLSTSQERNWQNAIPSSAKKIDMQFCKTVNLDDFTGGGKEGDECIVHAVISSTAEGTVPFGFGADWFCELYINGKICASTILYGNVTAAYSVDNNRLELPVRQGKNLLTAKVRRGRDTWSLVVGPAESAKTEQPEVPEMTFNGIAGKLHIGKPELYVDNKSRNRSGHMSHAMLEYAPGKILAFNSNCSARRFGGHAAYGFLEYRYSDDAGKTWGDIHVLPLSMQVLLDGINTLSAEKAVICNGIITVFLLRNNQSVPICCEPWNDPPVYIRSYDFGKTWTEPQSFSPYAGRIYDAVVHDGSIYVLELCKPDFYAVKDPSACYRLYRSDDSGATFYEAGPVDIPVESHGYGALQFRPDGSLVAYACNILNGYELAESVSTDCGKTWKRQPVCKLDKGIRNVQIGMIDGKYIMHGRAYLGAESGKGFVVYTSKDGLNWDEGFLMEPEKQGCYYSNNLTIKGADGKERLLVQYSDVYQEFGRVNVMHRWFYFE